MKYGMGHWGLVKGNIEKGESKEETIRRELREETRIKDSEIIEGFEEKIDYYYKLEGKSIHKFVTYLLVRVHQREVRLSYEHDDFKWLPFDEAEKKVDFEDVEDIIGKAREFLA